MPITNWACASPVIPCQMSLHHEQWTGVNGHQSVTACSLCPGLYVKVGKSVELREYYLTTRDRPARPAWLWLPSPDWQTAQRPHPPVGED